ncbi:MAG: RNA-binding protein [Rhodospirillales bacterium]
MPRLAHHRETERRCIVSGDVRSPDELIRFVVGPDQRLVPDVDGRLPGRGIWLRADRAAIEKARDKRLFAKAARQQVDVSESLADDVAALLLDRCLRRIGLARRAGEAVAGFEKVSDWIRRGGDKGRGGLLLEARDGANDGKGKLIRLARALGEETGIRVETVECFDAAEIGQALGLDHAVHAAVSAGGNADALKCDALRLLGVRTGAGKAVGSDAEKQCLQAEA